MRPSVITDGANDSLESRLYSKGVMTPSGCLEYTGYICPMTGYGKVSNNPQGPLGAHRAAWMLRNGPIPDGLVVRHKCDNRKCFNVEHLELGTHADNNSDMMERGRFDNYKSRIHMCPSGHEYDSKDSEGYRSCGVCRKMQSREQSAKRRALRGVTSLDLYCNHCWYMATNCHCNEVSQLTSDKARYKYRSERTFS